MAKHVEAMNKTELIKVIKDRNLSTLSASALQAQYRADLLRIVVKGS